jgi:hypothetical protein
MPQAIPSVLLVSGSVGITLSTPPEPISVTLTNAEKQARYRERHLGVDGEKVRVGLISTPAPGRKWAALHATEVIQ